MEGSEKLKLLMTADAVGGVWTYCIELAEGLGQKVEIHLAVMGKAPDEAQRRQAKKLSNLHLHVFEGKLEWMDDPWEDVERSCQWLKDLERKLRPDIMHLNTFSHAALSWQVPVVTVFHSCVLSWWQAVMNEEAPARFRTYYEKVNTGLQRSDVVVAPTEALLSEAKSIYGPFRKSRYIYNGIGLERFSPAPKEPFIFSMGRIWDDAKNLKLLAEAAGGITWPVYIAGDNTDPGNGKKAVHKNVQLLGKLSPDEVRHWLSKAAIYAMPARYEPFGLSLLEAAASGCALLAGDIPTLREVWEEAAWYVSTSDTNDLLNKTQQLIKDASVREDMGRRAMERAAAFSARKMAQDYLKLYRNLLRREMNREADIKKIALYEN